MSRFPVPITACLALAVLLLAPLAARSEGSVVVTSGKPGGYYESVAQRLQVVLASELDAPVELRNSQGSIENLVGLADPESPVNVGLTQADALAHFLKDDPSFEGDYVVLARIGRECAFLIASKHSGVTSASDLKKPSGGRTVAVGDPWTGNAVTYEYLSRIDPGFRNAPAEHMPIVEAMLQMEAPAVARTDAQRVGAAMVVQRPLLTAPPIQIAMENRDLYRIVPILASDLSGDAGKQQKVYTFEEVSLGFGRDQRVEVETICTQGYLIASRFKFSEDELAALTRSVLARRSYIAPGAR